MSFGSVQPAACSRCHWGVAPATGETEHTAPGSRASSEFDAFYTSHFSTAARLAHLISGSAAGAEDIAQEAMARLHPRFAQIDNPAGYLRTTVVNLCRNRGRGQTRERRRLERFASVDAPPPGTLDLLDAVDRLPFRERAVLVLRYWLDLPEAEIARVLGCPAGTVKSLASRGLARLRADFEEDER
jgi:RNA polymerase sigma-70 factor (sigma-E family)